MWRTAGAGSCRRPGDETSPCKSTNATARRAARAGLSPQAYDEVPAGVNNDLRSDHARHVPTTCPSTNSFRRHRIHPRRPRAAAEENASPIHKNKWCISKKMQRCEARASAEPVSDEAIGSPNTRMRVLFEAAERSHPPEARTTEDDAARCLVCLRTRASGCNSMRSPLPRGVHTTMGVQVTPPRPQTHLPDVPLGVHGALRAARAHRMGRDQAQAQARVRSSAPRLPHVGVVGAHSFFFMRVAGFVAGVLCLDVPSSSQWRPEPTMMSRDGDEQVHRDLKPRGPMRERPARWHWPGHRTTSDPRLGPPTRRTMRLTTTATCRVCIVRHHGEGSFVLCLKKKFHPRCLEAIVSLTHDRKSHAKTHFGRAQSTMGIVALLVSIHGLVLVLMDRKVQDMHDAMKRTWKNAPCCAANKTVNMICVFFFFFEHCTYGFFTLSGDMGT